MPAKMERNLKRGARRRGLKPGSKRYGAYVYGTMAKKKKGKKR